MAGGILYLDIDDEITSAAARIRSAEGSRVAVVLPHGSRVATSRINFRLLARDALTHQKRLSIVAADPAARALAASAGLPVFGSVGEYEGSLGPAEPDVPDAPAAAIAAEPPPTPVGGETVRTQPAGPDLDAMEVAALAAAGASIEHTQPRPVPPPAPSGPPPTPPDRPPTPPDSALQPPATAATAAVARSGGGRVGRTSLLAGAAVIALVVLIGSVAAYLLLPSATIVVTPKEESVGPVVMTIVADPAATVPDPVAGVVSADIVNVDVSATDTFPATGKRVEKAKATGTVRFRNKDFTSSNTIPAGSIVSTPQGVRFRTNAAVTVGRADIVGLQVFPKTASVKVTAVEAGPDGNVPPNAIVVIPRSEDPISLDVTNPDDTSGGKLDEFPKVTQEDVDKALAALQPALEASFATQLADPTVAPPGATVFPETGVLGPSTPSVDPATLVDQEVESFELTLTATGTATAVDEAPIATIAEEALLATIDDDHQLVEGSTEVTVDPGVVSGTQVRFPATATASQIAILDPAALEAEILGKPVAEAEAILERYGTVDLTVWPDWVSTIPTIDSRVEVTVSTAVPVTP